MLEQIQGHLAVGRVIHPGLRERLQEIAPRQKGAVGVVVYDEKVFCHLVTLAMKHS